MQTRINENASALSVLIAAVESFVTSTYMHFLGISANPVRLTGVADAIVILMMVFIKPPCNKIDVHSGMKRVLYKMRLLLIIVCTLQLIGKLFVTIVLWLR
ncbi:MAG: hypothetical protein ABFD64_13965 [Armatimonadota bacterium]